MIYISHHRGQKLSRTLGIKIGGKFVVELFDSKVEQKKAGKKAEKKAEHNANDSGEDEVDPPEDDVAEEPPKAKTTKRGGKRKRDGSDTNAEYEYRDDTRKILTAHTQREIGKLGCVVLLAKNLMFIHAPQGLCTALMSRVLVRFISRQRIL